MAGSAGFVQPCHGQSSRWLEDVPSVRIMALRAVHVILDKRMMVGQLEFPLNVEVTLKAGAWIVSRIDNEFAVAATCGDVLAARAVAGFATCRFGGL